MDTASVVSYNQLFSLKDDLSFEDTEWFNSQLKLIEANVVGSKLLSFIQKRINQYAQAKVEFYSSVIENRDETIKKLATIYIANSTETTAIKRKHELYNRLSESEQAKILQWKRGDRIILEIKFPLVKSQASLYNCLGPPQR